MIQRGWLHRSRPVIPYNVPHDNVMFGNKFGLEHCQAKYNPIEQVLVVRSSKSYAHIQSLRRELCSIAVRYCNSSCERAPEAYLYII